jgi:hypothetical protein
VQRRPVQRCPVQRRPVNGRFAAGSADPRNWRGQLATGRTPGHHRLAEYLDQPVNWDAEFAADLADFISVIRALGTG